MCCQLCAEGDLYDTLMQQVDSVLGAFEKEMKAQKLWDSVSLLAISDFGRTLTSNGLLALPCLIYLFQIDCGIAFSAFVK